MSDRYDVIVVGGGNAGMCAALSAQEHGARVLVLEKAPEAWRGGNGFFPGAPKLIADRPELSPETKRQILAGGAIGFYKL